MTDEIAESLGLDKPRGALIASVNDDGPAQVAGIQPGDVILSFDGKDVDRHAPPAAARRRDADRQDRQGDAVAQAHADQRRRQGRRAEGERAAGERAARRDQENAKKPAGLVKTLGLTLSGVTPDLKDKYSLGDDAKGVVVIDVAKNSTADDRGVRPGDVIVEVAQEEVRSPQDVSAKVDQAKKSGRKSILLLVDRQGDLRFVALRLDRS